MWFLQRFSFPFRKCLTYFFLSMFFLYFFLLSFCVQVSEQTYFYQYSKTTKYALAKNWKNKNRTFNASNNNNSMVYDLQWPLKPLKRLSKKENHTVQHNEVQNETDFESSDEAWKPLITQERPEGAFCRRSFDGRNGYCVLANQCLHVVREFRVHGTRIDICTHRKAIPVICCPLADKHREERRLSGQKCIEYHPSVDSLHIDKPRFYSGKKCIPSVPLIVGGRLIHHNEYPEMVALGWTQSSRLIKWGCGGTLLSDRYVLTAAHCTNANSKPPDIVRLGAWNLNRNSSHHLDVKILIIVVHPKYRSLFYYYDIALLKLTRRVHFTDYIQPACLWQLSELNVPSVIAVGWGRTSFMGPKQYDLRKVHLNIIGQNTCQVIYRKERRLPRGILEEQFCAGYLEGGRDTCQGDSGGPLFVELPEYNCVRFVIGITSFGKFCAAPNAPGVYTRIHNYLDWIEKIVFTK